MAPEPAPGDAPVVGSHVEVIGGRYRDRRCKVIGETKEFWHLHLQDQATCRVKKSNVRKVVNGAHAQSSEDEHSAEQSASANDVPDEAEEASPQASKNEGLQPGSAAEGKLDACTPDNVVAEDNLQEADSKPAAILKSHKLSILSWNTSKLSFMGRHQEALGEHVKEIADEIAQQGIEVIVLQEVPKLQGPSRVRALRERLNQALLRIGVGDDTLFSEPAFSAKAEGREIHALLFRPPVRLDQVSTLTEVGGVSFTYPPLLALLCDDRFSFPSLQRMALTSVHTPGSADLQRSRQRALEVNRLLSGMQHEVTSRFNDTDGLLFSDLRMRRKADATKACAMPFVLCGDLNLDFFKSECAVRPDNRQDFCQGLGFRPLPSVNRVEVQTSSGCWVAGAPPGRVTSGGGRCIDFFFWNADSAKRMDFTVRPMHLSLEALKAARHPGLSDHDAIVLEMSEDPLHRRQARAALGRRAG
mmetsp:Transcript_39766/g.124005  ORF Transcript_39766/g.124005 Transcript_39766/m.124005 type:complete len:472 (+) Transcript_39766:71-1486(+)